ncbi:MAG TPA: hypothetical protein VN377_01955 [Candidatus Thermoplasmatota archaeon]|nr:hypothetical protein [Candidatus Thermoplasmatota archaeon]
MKKINYMIISVLSCVLLFNTLGSFNASAAGLQVSFSTNPKIVAPGTNGYIEVNLRSTSTVISSIDITAESWDPAVVIPQGNWEVDVGSLDSGESYTVIFEFKIPSTAAPGLYQVLFEITGGNTIRQTAVIQVQDATILDLTSVTPPEITVGVATTLLFNITNNGGVGLENILFTWKDPNSLILPLGADNRITIPSIGAENHTEIPVVVMASSGISPGIYPLTITMEYYDQTGMKQMVNSTVGLQVSGTTTFDLVVQQSTSGSTTFSVVNTGANVASSVIVSIPQQPNYRTSGVSSTSLGNLNAGDYTLATFQLSSTTNNSTSQFPSFNRTETGTQTGRNFSGRNTFMNQSFAGLRGNSLLIQITYTDVFGIRQTIQKQVTMSSSSSFGSIGSPTSRSSTGTQNSFGGFSQSQSSGSNNSLVYIAIGAAGIIVIIGIIQLGRKKKLTRITKIFKGRKE